MSITNEIETEVAKGEAALKSVEAAVKAKLKALAKAALSRVAYVGVGVALAIVARHFLGI